MRLRLVPCALLLAASVPASAQLISDEPDLVGFYGEPWGNVPGVCGAFTTHTVHLLVTAPSDASGMTGFQASFEMPANVTFLGFTPAGGIVVAPVWPDLDLAWGTPQTVQEGPAYYVGTLQLLIDASYESSLMLMDHFPAAPYDAAYATVGHPDPLPLAAPFDPDTGSAPCGAPEGTVLSIERLPCCDVVVPAAPLTWGAVKAVFR